MTPPITKYLLFTETQQIANYGTAVVGTVSGTSISFGTPVCLKVYANLVVINISVPLLLMIKL